MMSKLCVMRGRQSANAVGITSRSVLYHGYCFTSDLLDSDETRGGKPPSLANVTDVSGLVNHLMKSQAIPFWFAYLLRPIVQPPTCVTSVPLVGNGAVA